MVLNQHLKNWSVLLATVVAAGCSSESEYESHFVYSEETSSLISEAADGTGDGFPGVKGLVDERFGTPNNLVAWEKLPIDFGGVSGTVSETPDSDSAIKKLKVSLPEGFAPDTESGIPVQFVSGSLSGSVIDFSDFDQEASVLESVEAVAGAPQAGDSFVINGGSVLKHGRMLYMRHCSHCHGTSGDGQGPTAEYLNPRPRDYRHGVFKFTSTDAQAKVSRDDLHRVLKYGIPGTYMPSFLLLPDDELHAIVEYVRFLAMRGEFERKLVALFSVDFSLDSVATRISDGESRSVIVDEFNEFITEYFAEELEFISSDLHDSWSAADESGALITPTMARVPDSEESRRRGRELYLSARINCADCHGIDGKGDGPQTLIYEKNPVTQELYNEPGLHDVWDNVNQPRNLTYGIYRGGRRPIDLFRRIHAGIKGSRMPSFKNVPENEIWDIVNYVLSLPFDATPGAATPVDAAAE